MIAVCLYRQHDSILSLEIPLLQAPYLIFETTRFGIPLKIHRNHMEPAFLSVRLLLNLPNDIQSHENPSSQYHSLITPSRAISPTQPWPCRSFQAWLQAWQNLGCKDTFLIQQGCHKNLAFDKLPWSCCVHA